MGPITINQTQVQGGIVGDRLKINPNRTLGQETDSGGGGGGTPASPSGSIQFNNSGSFGGDVNFSFDPLTEIVSLTDGTALALFNGSAQLQIGSSTQQGLSVESYGSTGLTSTFVCHGDVAGANPIAQNIFTLNSFSQTSSQALAVGHRASGAGVTVDLHSDLYVSAQVVSGGAAVTIYNALYVKEQIAAANNYYSWFDSRGVRRVKEDNTFNSVGQAIEALYNPQVTKYTPGAADYERIILGQWNGNVGEIGIEKGGSGTLRALRFMGLDFLARFENSAAADASLAAGDFNLWLDATNGAGKLMIKGKTANGTVVTGSVTLT